MDLTVHIPDDIATRLHRAGNDPLRRGLEALPVEEYKSGHINKPELRRRLGYRSRYQLDGFFRAHGVVDEGFTVEELEQQAEGLKQLGF
jgi:hypothetical protein